MSLEKKISNLRFKLIESNFKSQTAHLASALSCFDILCVIFFKFLRKQDYFILSKGHAAQALYQVLFEQNKITKKEFDNYSKSNSNLEEHPNTSIPGVVCSTGSLGHGLSFACGLNLANRLKKKNQSKIFTILGDGECNEGTVWESALFASSNKLNNIIAFIDYNKLQGTGRTEDILKLKPLSKKWKSFGWNVFEINGHSLTQIIKTINKINKSYQKRPNMIIAHTIKGKGVKFMENNNNWHYRSPNYLELLKSKKELIKNEK